MNEYALTSSAMRNPSRDVCENGAAEIVGLRERRAVDEDIESAEFLVERSAELGDLIVVRHIARQDEGIVERRRKLANVLLEAGARIREREARPGLRERLRDRPRNRSLVGNAHDKCELA